MELWDESMTLLPPRLETSTSGGVFQLGGIGQSLGGGDLVGLQVANVVQTGVAVAVSVPVTINF